MHSVNRNAHVKLMLLGCKVTSRGGLHTCGREADTVPLGSTVQMSSSVPRGMTNMGACIEHKQPLEQYRASAIHIKTIPAQTQRMTSGVAQHSEGAADHLIATQDSAVSRGSLLTHVNTVWSRICHSKPFLAHELHVKHIASDVSVQQACLARHTQTVALTWYSWGQPPRVTKVVES